MPVFHFARKRNAVILGHTPDGHPIVAAARVQLIQHSGLGAWKMVLRCPYCGRVHVHGLGPGRDYATPGSGDGTWVPHCPTPVDARPSIYHLQEEPSDAGDLPRHIRDAIPVAGRPIVGLRYALTDDPRRRRTR